MWTLEVKLLWKCAGMDGESENTVHIFSKQWLDAWKASSKKAASKLKMLLDSEV